MAHTANIQKVIDGDRNAVFHIFIRGDGASADLNKVTLIDPLLDFTPPRGRKPCMSITEIWSSLAGFDARLEFDYLNDETGVWAISRGSQEHVNFESFGGLKDRSPTLDGTGKLLLSTSGLLSADCCGSLVIKVRKD